AGLELLNRALVHFGLPSTEVQSYVDGVRSSHYAPLTTGEMDPATVDRLRKSARTLAIAWHPLGPGSPMAGHTLEELRIRARTGASVVAVVRGEELVPSPHFEFVLAE